jgi:hypothetical protein
LLASPGIDTSLFGVGKAKPLTSLLKDLGEGPKHDPLSNLGAVGAQNSESKVELPPPKPLGTGDAEVDCPDEEEATDAQPPLPPRNDSKISRGCSREDLMQVDYTKRFAEYLQALAKVSTASVHSPSEDSKDAASLAHRFNLYNRWIESERSSTTNPGDIFVKPGATQNFRVRVPKPYPGVQLRRSMRFDDKHQRFVEDGKAVSGEVDATGTWLVLGPDLFLPMKVGAIEILVPMPDDSEKKEVFV